MRPVVIVFALLAAVSPASVGAQSADTPAPFYNLRERSFDSVEADDSAVTNLTRIPIGWFGPTNADDVLGGEMWWAVDFAIREANENGGAQGRPFRLVGRWSDNPWSSGVAALFRAVYEEHVLAIIGSIDGPTTHLAEQLVAKARLPLISPVSTDKSVNLAGVPWMFSCAPDDHVLAPLVAGAIAAELRSHGGPFVILSATDHDSRLASHEILKALSERRVVVDQRFEFQPGAVSFESQRAAMQARPPAVALVIAGPEDSARVVIALRQRRPEATVFGTHQMGRHLFLRRAGAAAEGARFPLLFVLDSSDPVSRRFVERFGKQFGHEPDYAAALSHDAARLLVAAVARAGLDRARLREAIVALPPWRGTAGEIRWDSTGQNTRGVPQMGVVRDGRLVPLQSPASRSAQESRGATRSSGLP